MNTVKYLLKSLIGISFFFVLMFIAAGTANYPQGWIYFVISIFGAAISIATTKGNDALLNERSGPGAHTPSWDKKILGASAALTMTAYVIAGLDAGRFHWSSSFDVRSTVLGVLLVVLGQVIFITAKHQNAFFSSVARIQTERGHEVCDRGLYMFVRHPGYFGMILSWIGFPLLLHSAYSAIPVLVAAALLIARTSLEDELLSKELTGYKEYMQRTKYRLLPFVW